jgi:hypothetical protein
MTLRRSVWAAAIVCALAGGAGLRAYLDREADDLTAEWRTLFTACREAIEKRAPLETRGLVPMEPPRGFKTAQSLSRSTWRMFGRQGGSLAIVEREWGPSGKTTRTCMVHRDPWKARLNETQSALLQQAFVFEAVRLGAEGKYRSMDARPSYPLMSFVVQSSEKNPSGCFVALVLSFSAKPLTELEFGEEFFRSGVGEQTFTPFGGAAFLCDTSGTRL